MDLISFLLILVETLLILTLIYAFRELIISKIYGKRFQRWVILDTGEQGYSITNRALNLMQVAGRERTISRKNILKGICYYVDDCVENIIITSTDYDRYTAYCNTDEFTTVLHTKLLQMLLYIFEKNLIMIAIVIGVLTLAIAGYTVYLVHNQSVKLDFIVYEVNKSASNSNIVRVP